MSRKKLYRHNLVDRVQRVAVKNPTSWLIQLAIDDYGLSLREAEIVALKAHQYINQRKQGRGFEQIKFKLIAGRESHSRKYTQGLKEVTLTPFCYDDLELLEEFGLKTMQNARIFRLIEEAYAQDAIFPSKSLSFLTGLAVDAVRKRLTPLWEEKIRLPLSGMKKTWRNFQSYRTTRALKALSMGEKPSEIRKNLALSRTRLAQARMELEACVQKGAEGFDEGLPGLQKEYKKLAKSAEYGHLHRRRVQTETGALFEILKAEHNFSPAKARDFIDRLDEFMNEEFNDQRAGNTAIYFAISEEEPAGKAIDDCELVPVTLEYYNPDNLAHYDGKKTRDIKWKRIVRYTTQARKGGGLLSQADLSFLMGVDTSVIRLLLKEHPDVLVPTRGQIADIGCGLTHVEKIIELYLDGYTETQIQKRTGHSYESIENYLKTFASVVVLSDRGMPVGMMRKATGRSRKLIEHHLRLYEKHKHLPDVQLVLMNLRNSFTNRENDNPFNSLRLKGGDSLKRKSNRYSSFVERNLENAQRRELSERFDFGKESWLANKLTLEFNKLMDEHERKHGIERLAFGDLLTLHNGHRVVLPLLDPDTLQGLAKEGMWSKYSLLLEDSRLRALRCYDSEAEREDLRRLVNLRGMIFTRGKGQKKVLGRVGNYKLVDPHEIGKTLDQRTLDREEVSVPDTIYQQMMQMMTVEENVSQARADAVIEELAYIRALFSPLKSELKPGQVVWNGIAITDRQQKEKKTRYREQVPLILTVQDEDEIGISPSTLEEVDCIHKKQMARMCVEAYVQGAVLTTTDLHLLTFRSPGTVSKLVNEYMVENEVILPTAGTVKDAGRAMTHKHLVINLHLKGLYAKEIAQKTYHSEDAVDRYLDLFNAVLILYLYELPVKLMARVTGRGVSLIEEHLKIVKEHFPDKSEVKNYLRERGVEIA